MGKVLGTPPSDARRISAGADMAHRKFNHAALPRGRQRKACVQLVRGESIVNGWRAGL